MLQALPPLAVTMGDPAGIGPDITLLACSMRAKHSLPDFFVVGSAEVLEQRARELNLPIRAHHIADAGSAREAPPGALNVLDLGSPGPVVPGRTDSRFAPLIIGSIATAVELVMTGQAAGVVTQPIAKATLTAAGFAHPGHTEFLADLATRAIGKCHAPVMMLASTELRVVPLTVHIPLAQVPAAITRDLIMSTVRTTIADLQRYFGVKAPRIAIAGLNPHAGESGTLGREEIEIIAPAIDALRREGHDVVGPLSGDTMFHPAARKRYDAAIAMYHDQALIPLKTVAFDSGVNVTLGLPFVRTSPDHGTAFDIAGTGRANPASFVAALEMAATMSKRAGTDL